MEFRPYLAESPQDLATTSQQHGGIQVISQLSREELVSSASQWTLRHLLAYRLLVETDRTMLPTFRDGHDQQCPVCETRQQGPQHINRDKTDALLGENPRELLTKSESELMGLSDGFFWVALARIARPDLVDQPGRVHPDRARNPPEREGFVNSSSAIPGSSSPTAPLSSSEFEPDLNDLDEDEHEARRNKPEDVTVHFVSCFLQYALNLCLSQHNPGHPAELEVRFRIERKLTKARIAGAITISAEDDGGICLVRRVELGWEMRHPYLARLEAKRAFRHFHFDARTESYSPLVSNETLAQWLGEAVIAWRGDQEFFPNG